MSLLSLDSLLTVDPDHRPSSRPSKLRLPSPPKPQRSPLASQPTTPTTGQFPVFPPSLPSSPRHPLKSPRTVDGFDGVATSSSSSLIAGPSSVRSRKPLNGQVELDVTRPALQRLMGQTVKDAREGGAGLFKDELAPSASGARPSLDELTRPSTAQNQERDVVVHQIRKTDTIASISLRYGITPQALRLANRMWPSDSIHLRAHLNIPLDQCHLPSSSAIGGIARNEGGSLVLWEKDAPTTVTQPPTPTRDLLAPTPAATPPIHGGNFPSNGILAPTARRAASSSIFELSGGSTSDLLGDSLPSSAKGKGRQSDAVSSYLASTNNPYSSPAPSPPSLPFQSSPAPLSIAGLNISDVPFVGKSMPSRAESTVSTSSISARTSIDSANPFANGVVDPAAQGRRTLVVERVPAAALSFFPPPNTTNGTESLSPNISRANSFEDIRPKSPAISYAALSPTTTSPENLPFSDRSASPVVPGRLTTSPKQLRTAPSLSNFHSTARRTTYGGPSKSGKPSAITPLAPSGVPSVKTALDWVGLGSLVSPTTTGSYPAYPSSRSASGSTNASASGAGRTAQRKASSKWDIFNFGAEGEEAEFGTGMKRVESWGTPPSSSRAGSR